MSQNEPYRGRRARVFWPRKTPEPILNLDGISSPFSNKASGPCILDAQMDVDSKPIFTHFHGKEPGPMIHAAVASLARLLHSTAAAIAAPPASHLRHLSPISGGIKWFSFFSLNDRLSSLISTTSCAGSGIEGHFVYIA